MNGGLLLQFAGTGWLLLVSEVAKTKLAAPSLMSQGLRNWSKRHAQTHGVGVAAGYRLVFPAGARGETIRIAPTVEPSETLSYWSLAPFQIPDDLRIQDGHSYRTLWVDGLGRPLDPQGTTHLPALHAFLGPPDAEATVEDERYDSMLRDVTASL